MKNKNKQYRKHFVKENKHVSQFALSSNNQITYVYKTDRQEIMMEITCVSLEINILDQWITIIFYDNHHAGKLHRHTRIAYNDEADITDYKNVKMKGSLNNLLTWSIKDIQNNFIIYKRKFIKRNRPILNDVEIEEY